MLHVTCLVAFAFPTAFCAAEGAPQCSDESAGVNEDVHLVQNIRVQSDVVLGSALTGYPAVWKVAPGTEGNPRVLKIMETKCKKIDQLEEAREICNSAFRSKTKCDSCSACRWKYHTETKKLETDLLKYPTGCYAGEYPWTPPQQTSYEMYPARWLPPKFKGKFGALAEKQTANCQSIERQDSARDVCPGFKPAFCGWCTACRFRNLAAKNRNLPIGCYSREPPWWPVKKSDQMFKTLMDVISKNVISKIKKAKANKLKANRLQGKPGGKRRPGTKPRTKSGTKR